MTKIKINMDICAPFIFNTIFPYFASLRHFHCKHSGNLDFFFYLCRSYVHIEFNGYFKTT